MRKSNLITGIVYVIIGVVCLLSDLLGKASFYGFDVFFLVYGGRAIYKYCYWNAPENRERRQEILDHENIEMQDELKVKIKDKAGRYAYTIGQYIICFFIFLLCILGKMGIIGDESGIVMTLGGVLVVQLIIEKIAFQYISKKF